MRKLLWLLLAVAPAYAQIPQPIRDTPYDWRCVGADGTVVSEHQRQDTAIYACQVAAQNAPGAVFYIEGGRYRVEVGPVEPDEPPTEPPTDPAIHDATLSWVAPTQNTDGSPLTDLAGYKLYWGQESRTYSDSREVGNVTSYTLEGLGPGTWYFAVTALNAAGAESGYSDEASTSFGDGMAAVVEQSVLGTVSGTGAVVPGVTAGSALVSLLHCANAVNRQWATSDNVNTGWVNLSPAASGPDSRKADAAYLLNAGAGDTTVTTAVEAGSNFGNFDVLEVSGVDELDVDFTKYESTGAESTVNPVGAGVNVAANSISFLVVQFAANPGAHTFTESGWVQLSTDLDALVAYRINDTAVTGQTAQFTNGTARSLASIFFSLRAAGGGGGETAELSGSGSLDLAASGNLTGSAALSGSGSLGLAASGGLGGDAALSGSGSLGLTASGGLDAAAALSGSGTLGLTASGDLTGDAGLSGSGVLGLVASGNLVGDASLSGSAGLTLAASGNVDIADNAELSGSASLGLAASGNLVGDAALSGTSDWSLTASGNLLGGDEVEPAGGHYWPTERKKRKDYRKERDEQRLEDRQGLRALIERAAGLLDTAEEIAEPEAIQVEPARFVPRPVFRSQVSDLRAELDELKAYVETYQPAIDEPEIDLEEPRRRIESIIARSTDDLIDRIADVLADLVTEIIEDEELAA